MNNLNLLTKLISTGIAIRIKEWRYKFGCKFGVGISKVTITWSTQFQNNPMSGVSKQTQSERLYAVCEVVQIWVSTFYKAQMFHAI